MFNIANDLVAIIAQATAAHFAGAQDAKGVIAKALAGLERAISALGDGPSYDDRNYWATVSDLQEHARQAEMLLTTI